MKTSRASKYSYWERKRSERQFAEKRSDDLFFYLCDHVVKANWRILDGIAQKQKDMLTVMSFCLLGEMTFIATNIDRIGSCIPARVSTIASLLAWVAAFCIGLFMWRKDKGFLVVPGENERVSFLPTQGDDKSFMNEPKERLGKVDEFMMRSYFNRIGQPLDDALEYEQVVSAFNEAIRHSDDLQDFNKNAWLASLVHVFYPAEVMRDISQRQFLAINVLFIINIGFLITSIAFCLFLTQPAT